MSLRMIVRVVILAGLVAGCGKFYWESPGRTVTDFGTDSGQCIKDATDKYEVSERVYRRCMRAHGWQRVQTHYPTDRQFRGPEDEDDFAAAPDPLSARGPVSSVSPVTPMAAAVAPTVGDLRTLMDTWTGTMTGGAELRVRHDVTLRIFEEAGEIRWEGHRRWSSGESRGSGTVAVAEDGIVLSGHRRRSGSSETIAVRFTLTRRGQTLEGHLLSPDNRVYMMVLTRSR